VGSSWGHSFLQASTCSIVGSLPWATGGDLLLCGPPRAAGEQPSSPWSAPGAAGESVLWRLKPSYPSFCTDLGVCRVVALTCSHSSLPLQFLLQRGFFPLLNYFISEALPPPLMGSAVVSSGSILEPAGSGSMGHRRASSSFSQKPPLYPPLPKPCHANPIE